PLFDSWSSNNSLTINVTSWGYLILWVDANDDGAWTSDECYQFMAGIEVSPSVYTVSGIKIHATQNFSRNGANKCAVRITLQDKMGGAPTLSPNQNFYFGEVEDWLIDVEPAKFTVATEAMRNATEGTPYNWNVSAVNGTPPYTWSLTAGNLP